MYTLIPWFVYFIIDNFYFVFGVASMMKFPLNRIKPFYFINGHSSHTGYMECNYKVMIKLQDCSIAALMRRGREIMDSITHAIRTNTNKVCEAGKI